MNYRLDRHLNQIVEDEVSHAFKCHQPDAARAVLKARLEFTGALYRRARHVLDMRIATKFEHAAI